MRRARVRALEAIIARVARPGGLGEAKAVTVVAGLADGAVLEAPHAGRVAVRAEATRLRLGDVLDLIIVQADAPVEKQMTPTITEEALQTA